MISNLLWLWAANFSEILFYYLENRLITPTSQGNNEAYMIACVECGAECLRKPFLRLATAAKQFRYCEIWERNCAWNSGITAQLNALSNKACFNFLKQSSLFVEDCLESLAICNLDLLFLLKAYIEYFSMHHLWLPFGEKKKKKKATHTFGFNFHIFRWLTTLSSVNHFRLWTLNSSSTRRGQMLPPPRKYHRKD